MSDTKDRSSKELRSRQGMRSEDESANNGVGSNRVDTAHTLGTGEEPCPPELASETNSVASSEASLSAVAGYGQSHCVDQLRSQAEQLAELLNEQQKKIDRRESQFNAQTAQLENELRTSRIWFRERELEFEEREKELKKQIAQLEQHATEVAAVEISSEEENRTLQKRITQELRGVEARDKELRAREHCLIQEKRALDTAEGQFQREKESAVKNLLVEQEQLAANHNSSEREKQTLKEKLECSQNELIEKTKVLESLQKVSATQSQAADQWQKKRHDLAETLTMLNKHLEELKRDQKLLETEREKFHTQIDAERQALHHERQDIEFQNRQQKEKLLLRSESLKKRLLATTQMREDVSNLHRESLEMRLVVEQLWLELAGEKVSAKVTQSISQIRAKLADHYRYSNQMLSGQKDEILRLGVKLDEKKRTLQVQQDEMQSWVSRREHEIEEQASRLVAREHELDLREKSISDKLKQCTKEKYQLQDQVRRLLDDTDSPAVKVA